MNNKYPIEGTSNRHPEQNQGAYLDASYWPNFQETINSFKQTLVDHVSQKKYYSVLRVGHSEFAAFYIIDRNRGRDAFTIRHSRSGVISKKARQDMFESITKTTSLSTQIGYDFQANMANIICITDKNKQHAQSKKHLPLHKLITLPLDIIYGLVANKWFFQTFKNRIGLIGAEQKLTTIKKLMEYREYQEYLGTDRFTDYIPIPQRGAFDDDSLTERVTAAVSRSSCDIFLIGAGVSKLRFFHALEDAKSCVFIDVGHGICMISGHGDNTRPYCGEWVNYKLPSTEKISEIDVLGSQRTPVINLGGA